ncbi:MAG TPA: FliA/WhiG family RNA polymerase sigma factor [Oscillospiraceae bacterium]|nr:FliA/WhiG family RNA polymerase sigma factor [Oscillospiraceae bacterium]
MELTTLWYNYKKNKDPQAKIKIIEHYIQLVKIIAGRLYTSYGTNIEYDDLVSYGIFGLIDAIEKFDLDRQVKFKTYAQIRIRGAIIDELRLLDWVPRSVRQRAKQVDEAYNKLENQLGRSASETEVANELGITVKELQNILMQTNSFNIVSLEETIFENNIIPKQEQQGYSPEELICTKETYNILRKKIEQLPNREKQVISLYYYNNLTYKEIGAILGVSESRVSQLHSKAILGLKSKLTEK